MLTAARIARSAEAKNSSPSTLREFVALFCAERRNKRRGVGWEVMDWHRVTDFKESAENYFGRILLPGKVGAWRECGTAGSAGGVRTVVVF